MTKSVTSLESHIPILSHAVPLGINSKEAGLGIRSLFFDWITCFLWAKEWNSDSLFPKERILILLFFKDTGAIHSRSPIFKRAMRANRSRLLNKKSNFEQKSIERKSEFPTL